MKELILDTNVFISGIFWSGPPYRILDAWRNYEVKLIFSSEILNEYIRVGEVLEKKYRGVTVAPFIDLLVKHGELCSPIVLKKAVSRDPDDDKFIAAALGAHCNLLISGDQDLLVVSGYGGLEIIKPATFCQEYLD